MPENYLGHIYMDVSDNNFEMHVTINPDPKRKHLGKQWACMSPKRQYKSLCYSIKHFIDKVFRDKVHYYRFVFELGTSGNVHAHGTIIIDSCPANTHMLKVKRFVTSMCEYYGRSVNNEMLMKACCMIKPKNDTIFGQGLYKTWDEYLNKDQNRIPKWMKSFSNSDFPTFEGYDWHVDDYTENKLLRDPKYDPEYLDEIWDKIKYLE